MTTKNMIFNFILIISEHIFFGVCEQWNMEDKMLRTARHGIKLDLDDYPRNMIDNSVLRMPGGLELSDENAIDLIMNGNNRYNLARPKKKSRNVWSGFGRKPFTIDQKKSNFKPDANPVVIALIGSDTSREDSENYRPNFRVLDLAAAIDKEARFGLSNIDAYRLKSDMDSRDNLDLVDVIDASKLNERKRYRYNTYNDEFDALSNKDLTFFGYPRPDMDRNKSLMKSKSNKLMALLFSGVYGKDRPYNYLGKRLSDFNDEDNIFDESSPYKNVQKSNDLEKYLAKFRAWEPMAFKSDMGSKKPWASMHGTKASAWYRVQKEKVKPTYFDSRKRHMLNKYNKPYGLMSCVEGLCPPQISKDYYYDLYDDGY